MIPAPTYASVVARVQGPRVNARWQEELRRAAVLVRSSDEWRHIYRDIILKLCDEVDEHAAERLERNCNEGAIISLFVHTAFSYKYFVRAVCK